MFCLHRLTKLEERSFAFTNAFTTAGEGSVIKLRDTYRNLQANARPAANRAHKKVYKGIDLPIAEHTMVLTDCIYVCLYVLCMYVRTVYSYVTGFWKTDQIVTLGLFLFIGPANGHTRTLHIHSAITRLGGPVCFSRASFANPVNS